MRVAARETAIFARVTICLVVLRVMVLSLLLVVGLRIMRDLVIKFLVRTAIALTTLHLHLLEYWEVVYLSLQKISELSSQ